MGSVSIARQALNVFRMKLLGATVIPVESGSRTLKDARERGAAGDWVSAPMCGEYYSLGSALGPHPYPMIVRNFHRVIGDEARAAVAEARGKLPDVIVAASRRVQRDRSLLALHQGQAPCGSWC